MATDKLHLDVVIDVVCPWCFVGKRRLDAAIESLPDIDFTVRYRPFQLDATIPAGGKSREAYLNDKFRDPARVAAMHRQIESVGADLDIPFAFADIEVSPNTLDAHRLVHWATLEGKGDSAVERLFSLYFVEGEDIGQAEVLKRAAADIGMDPEAVATKLANGTDREAVEEEIAFASRLGITGVPCTIVASKFAISGAQPADVMADALRQIAAETSAAG